MLHKGDALVVEAAHLEVLVEEVEDEQNGDQGGQSKGGHDADEGDGGCQLQEGTQEERGKVRQVLVGVHRVLGQPVDNAA